MPVDKAVFAAEIPVEDEVLAHQPYRFGRPRIELALAADRLPIAPQKLAHRRAGADAGKERVSFLGQHEITPTFKTPPARL
jgi:hypothetical protein